MFPPEFSPKIKLVFLERILKKKFRVKTAFQMALPGQTIGDEMHFRYVPALKPHYSS